MRKHYQIQNHYFQDEDIPYCYSIVYKNYYNGLDYHFVTVETFKNKNIAERVCDELNAREVLNNE